MNDKEQLGRIVSFLSQRYHFHETQTIRAFHREEARIIKEMLTECGIKLEDNHVGNARHEKWLAATGRNE